MPVPFAGLPEDPRSARSGEDQGRPDLVQVLFSAQACGSSNLRKYQRLVRFARAARDNGPEKSGRI